MKNIAAIESNENQITKPNIDSNMANTLQTLTNTSSENTCSNNAMIVTRKDSDEDSSDNLRCEEPPDINVFKSMSCQSDQNI